MQPVFQTRRIAVAAAGVLGTLLVHVLILLPFVLNLSLPSSHAPTRSGEGASGLASAQEPDMTVVFVNELSGVDNPLRKPDPLVSRSLAPRDLPVVVFSPDPSPAGQSAPTADSDDQSAPPESIGERTQHAVLYGRYLTQLQARIERAWVRPRSEIGAPKFSCTARIEQNPRGDVVGVTLDPCNGTDRWQQSLTSAIRTASPLPAPPDQSVYAARLWLSFESEGFRAGASPEGFEPENRASLLADEQSAARASFEHFADRGARGLQRKGRDDPDIIHLTIVGNAAYASQPIPTTNAPSTRSEPAPDAASTASLPQQ